ncbi:MAG: glycosyl transferase family 1 [Acidimicrobiales bacterium]|nr:MAG: glycosyl transferase family 1 [Acidimicrobiales bacterium]
MRHLLVTNDFPPKTGGIQTYLWELWRRLPTESFRVLTTRQVGAEAWDRGQPFDVFRSRRVFLPTPGLIRHVRRHAEDFGAELVLLDPVLPLGMIGPRLGLRYGLVAHGAEITVPGRLPLSRRVMARVLAGAEVVVAAGTYPAREAERAARRALPQLLVPPGVDPERFRPLDPESRRLARKRLGLGEGDLLVSSVSRLVPRKGMDVLVVAASRLVAEWPRLVVLIAGEGRDRARIERLIRRHRAPVRLLGGVADDDLPNLYGCSDLFAMLCRDRWAGLEQEGFGIVFMEAAACGVPSVAGDSGGVRDAVADGETGVVVRQPQDVDEVVSALRRLLSDPAERERMGRAARRRAVELFSYDHLAEVLWRGLQGLRW